MVLAGNVGMMYSSLKLSQWRNFIFKEDYTIVNKLRAVIYKDKNDQKKMLEENELHKFSDGTLTRILHKLDHIVKDFRLYQYNSGIEFRIWSKDDKSRSEEFMEVIEGRLKIQKIFWSLESFVGGHLEMLTTGVSTEQNDILIPILRRYVCGPKTQSILDQCHYGPIGGHYGPNTTAKKVLDSDFYWPTIINEAHTQVRLCEACQKTRNISKRDEMPKSSTYGVSISWDLF
uniref:Reverse transcriptase domain-containing protein n=1 Tax=Tanacetum cinerariifolium TaxID=118510 RepID=A0A6L2J1E7_TANCI|nr:reverse transcriptase domain-containing protein [Tanacetum cinerariifolium]